MAHVQRKRALFLGFACLVLLGSFMTAFYSYRKFSIQSDLLALWTVQETRKSDQETANRGLLSKFTTTKTTTTTTTTTTTSGEKAAFYAPGDLIDYPVPRLSHPTLHRALNDAEYKEMRGLMAELDKIFTENNITYMMVYGTLLGSYFVHDILPWDDDLDLFVEESDMSKMKALFKEKRYSHMETHHHTAHPSKMVKVYYKRSPHAGGYPWRWPFADVTTYKEVNGSICCIHDVTSGKNLSKESFYPFHRRPFAGLWLPSPRDPVQFFKQKYHTFSCKSHSWNHRRETSGKSTTVSCDALKGYYPMVYRSPEGTGVRETVKLGEKVLYSVYVNETYRGQSAPFELDGPT